MSDVSPPSPCTPKITPLAHSHVRLYKIVLPGSPALFKLSTVSAAVGSKNLAFKRADYARQASTEMDVRIAQVELSVMQNYIGGKNMTDAEVKDVKGFRKLAIVTTSKNVRKLEKTYYNAIASLSFHFLHPLAYLSTSAMPVTLLQLWWQGQARNPN
ncbi:uncharacterized protein PHACADRAFT_183158 [Phanerochaete carnosa HHB-10118-sp]|uniref:Uncharacterized protein n=1 Tax=Phanerochaete carnosa (strain HHB-10118-sp) TaxID=650164 RepID=K5V1X0_PHACS|nr:uncharacterized protein PHACADRAFT_183158 [Phanerochaete carnosa HHB-10118-sp]EKM56506.1 hypothetical protein PHACADRAFT_183158 [Phanerochaete carnosa HHB-10118-sp]